LQKLIRNIRDVTISSAGGTCVDELEDVIQRSHVLAGNEYRDAAVVTIQSQAGDA
jgi:hypothetical protein